MFNVGQLADRRARLPAGRNSIAGRERADCSADRIDQQIAVTLVPLVRPAKDRRRPLTRAADAHDVFSHFCVAVNHLREHVVRRIERYLHRLNRRGGHRRREIRAIEGARRRIERHMAQRAADAEVLVPAEQLIQRDHDGAAPARIRRVHRTALRRRPFVLEDELCPLLA